MINMIICFTIAVLLQAFSIMIILIYNNEERFTVFKLWASTVCLFISMIIGFIGVYFLVMDLIS
jgi:hypothetical protein